LENKKKRDRLKKEDLELGKSIENLAINELNDSKEFQDFKEMKRKEIMTKHWGQ
jgi:hypothetical protein